jgi:hypothetical protein
MHPTFDQLHQLGLTGMVRAFTELEANPTSAALSHAEWLGLLLDREATERYQRRLRARLRYARLRHQAAVEDVDCRAARSLDRTLFQALIAGCWIGGAELDHRRAGRRRQELARLCPRPQGAPRQPLKCFISASRACSATSHWPAATAATRA